MMDTIRSSVAKLVQARCANPGSCMPLTLYRLRSQVAGFSIDSHLGLIWYPLLVTALAGATVRARCTVAQPCTELLEAVVGIALEHSSLRAWCFFERAGARGLTDLSSVRFATKSHA